MNIWTLLLFNLNVPLAPTLLCVEPELGGRSRSDRGVRGEFRWCEEGIAGWWHQSETEGVGAEDSRSVVWDCCWCKVWSVCHFDSLSAVLAPLDASPAAGIWPVVWWEVAQTVWCHVVQSWDYWLLVTRPRPLLHSWPKCWNYSAGCQWVCMHIPFFPLRVTLLSAAQPPLCTWKHVVQFKCKFPHGRRVTIWVT